MVRVAIPTKDRPGTIALAVAAIADQLSPAHELIVYDDGDRPASADYAFRGALDIATTLGIEPVVIRGKAEGINRARSRILEDAHAAEAHFLLMLDDDVIVRPGLLTALGHMFDTNDEIQYAVPVIGLTNNEAGVARFGTVTEATSTHDQQFVLNGKGVHRIVGGAWTCAILMDLSRFDALDSARALREGPSVVEDYVLTQPLIGYVDRSQLVWHVMSPEQGLRDWDGRALKYLRDQLGKSE